MILKIQNGWVIGLGLILFPRPSSGYDAVHLLGAIQSPQLKKPVAAVSDGERLYALDGGSSGLCVLDRDGKQIYRAGEKGGGPGGLSSPRGLALGRDGKIYVADTGNSRVQVLDAAGKFLYAFGERGSDPGQLSHPRSVAVGADGERVLVLDSGNNRIQIFTRDGIFLFGFGSKGKGDGQFKDPARVAVDPSEDIYVLDADLGSIQKFDPRGVFLKRFPVSGNDFVVDSYGFMYALDPRAGKIREIGPQGSGSGAFGTAGSGPGQMKRPAGIGLGPGGDLWISDTGNHRLLHFSVENHLKTQPLAADTSIRLYIKGPEKFWPVEAGGIAPAAGGFYAVLPRYSQIGFINAEGGLENKFGGKGKRLGDLRDPRGLAWSSSSGILVADAGNDRIQVFDASGRPKTVFGSASGFFASKKREGVVKDPHGLAVNGEGNIYIADTGNRRVQSFNPEGVYLFGFGPGLGSYELEEPVAVAWDPAKFVYVLDRKLKRVFKCEPSGGLVASWPVPEASVGRPPDPVDLSFDGYRYLYVLDAAQARVAVFDKDGNPVGGFLSRGSGVKNLSRPVSLAASDKSLVVSDPGLGKVVLFGIRPVLPPPEKISGSSVEGLVELSWEPLKGPWTSQYVVERSTEAGASYSTVVQTSSAGFKDPGLPSYTTFYYRVATQARTGEVGPASAPVTVYVTGTFNQPPLKISRVEIGNIYSANYKYYLRHPVGTLWLADTTDVPFKDVKVSFAFKDFMDYSYDKVLAEIEPHQTVEIPLQATFNNRILEVNEDTPIQAQFSLHYFEQGKPQVVSQNQPLKVYSRNAITWDVPERVANYITPKDPPILDFVRSLASEKIPAVEREEYLNGNLRAALRLWAGASSLGVSFLPDPTNPYEKMSQDPNFPEDFIQLPRETLKRKGGDCANLVALLASMLEASGIRTVLLDYPGHLALMFDTGRDDPLDAGLPEERFISYDRTYWVPVEATLLGKSFMESWRQSLAAYRRMSDEKEVSIIDVRKAWEDYEPVTMPDSGWDSILPDAEKIKSLVASDAQELVRERGNFLKKEYEAVLEKDPHNREARVDLGIFYAQQGEPGKAGLEFDKILQFLPNDPSALNNLGNVAYLNGDFAGAEARYVKASAADPGDPQIWMNLARAALKRKDVRKAKEYAGKALALDGSLKSDVEALLQGD